MRMLKKKMRTLAKLEPVLMLCIGRSSKEWVAALKFSLKILAWKLHQG